MPVKQISRSRLQTFTQIAKYLPRSRNNKRVHVSTLHRWRSEGKQGIFLQCIKTPGGWKTTLRYVEEFFQRLTESSQPTRAPKPGKQKRKELARQGHIQNQLDSLGL